MNVLFLGYWGANHGLSQATINPHLEILASFPEIAAVHYVSIERDATRAFKVPRHPKIFHHPYCSRDFRSRLLTKFMDIFSLTWKCLRLSRTKQIRYVICRSSLAGNVGHLIHLLTGLPYAVESFEPHAQYMAEMKIWGRQGLSYKVQSWWESRQKDIANHLMPVSEKYAAELRSEGISVDSISVVPCGVDEVKFGFQSDKREKVRDNLRLNESRIVGIYIGKFEGIYLGDDAFHLFRLAFDRIRNFYLVLLSPTEESYLDRMVVKYNLDPGGILMGHVPHDEVASYLSASDFAFSLHYPSPAMRFVNPIKNGEYWANGLPILMPKGIGDDSDLLGRHPEGGSCFELNSQSMIGSIDSVLSKLDNRDQIRLLARKYRSFDRAREVYKTILIKT